MSQSSPPDKRDERCMHGVWKADHCYACEKMGNEIYGATLTKEKIEEWRKDLVEWNEDPSDKYVKEVNQLCDAAMCAVSSTAAATKCPDCDGSGWGHNTNLCKRCNGAGEVNTQSATASAGPTPAQLLWYLSALVDQCERGNLVDDHGHEFNMNKALKDARALLRVAPPQVVPPHIAAHKYVDNGRNECAVCGDAWLDTRHRLIDPPVSPNDIRGQD